MKNSFTILSATLLAILLLAAALSVAAPPPISQSEMLYTMELALYGKPADGSIIPRVAKLEEAVLAKAGTGTLTERVDKLWEELGGGKEGVSMLDYKIKLAQWIVNGKVDGASLLDRLGALERALFGYPGKDALPARISRVIEVTSGKQGADISYERLAKGTKVKVEIITAMSTITSRPGDSVTIAVAEDVIVGSRLVIPAGTSWTSKIVAPTKSNKFDLKNLLELALEPLVAMDGTSVRLFVDDDSITATQTQSGLLICQGETADRLGFFTRGNAVDRLMPGTKNLEIPIGTKITLSVKEDASIKSAKVK